MRFITDKRYNFKSQTQFLRDVYNKNPEIRSKNISFERFEKQVEAYKVAYKTNVTGALRKIANTEVFTPYADRKVENFLKGLSTYGVRQEFKQMLRDERGRYAKFDVAKLKWDRDRHAYVYNSAIVISFSESPQRVNIFRV